MITIVDYSVNNLRSVQKAFAHLGYDVQVSSDPATVENAEKLVLPGVGAFGEAMRNLQARKLVEPIQNAARNGTPLMGVCLGMQLLFEHSEELGQYEGLGILSGRVVRFQDAPGLKIPHIGWNTLHFDQPSKLFAGLSEGAMVYFVHSYHVIPPDPAVIAATSCHPSAFVAGIEQGNVMGAQFHPEKSSAVGLQILDNFARL